MRPTAEWWSAQWLKKRNEKCIALVEAVDGASSRLAATKRIQTAAELSLTDAGCHVQLGRGLVAFAGRRSTLWPSLQLPPASLSASAASTPHSLSRIAKLPSLHVLRSSSAVDMKEKKALLPSVIGDVQMTIGDTEGKGDSDETDSLAMYIAPPPATEEKRFFLGETPSPPDSGFVTPCSKDSDVDPDDPWALPEIDEGDDGPVWIDLTCIQRIKRVLALVFRIVSLTSLLYLFICSLGLLSDSFQLVGGKAAGKVFSDSKLLRNPIAGLMIGVLGTVLLQSSSTSTSIVVGLVASEMLTVRQSIPIVMGANIGTSVTNTIVSVAHSGRRAEFRRAFAGATVHDMFNWLCVIILLPLEIACGYLFHTTGFVVRSLHISGEHKQPPKMLQHLTEPFTMLIVQLDKAKLSALGTESEEGSDSSLIKRNCARVVANTTETPFELCKHLFAYLPLSDATLGLILLIVSLVSLVLCLVLIVKLLNTMLRGQVAKTIRKTINNDLPGPFAPFTGYVGIAIGAGMTILIQSSSVFTSTLTPLVAVGVLSLERMYPLTLGANVGTTFTSLLAALASPPSRLTSALQISLCHLFFNLTGILLFFVVPITRQAPLGLARILGDKTAKYRWFALVYVALMFFLLPAAIFALSMAGDSVMLLVGAPVGVFLTAVVIINLLQAKLPSVLPSFLRDWEWLPMCLHSLEPTDALIVRLSTALPCCMRCCPADKSLVLGPDDHRSESRHRLLLTATCTPAPSIPSRLASRAASPSRFRDNLPNRTVPDTAV